MHWASSSAIGGIPRCKKKSTTDERHQGDPESLHRRDERYRDRVGDGTQVIEPIPSSYDGEASLIRSSKVLRVNRIIVRWIKLEKFEYSEIPVKTFQE